MDDPGHGEDVRAPSIEDVVAICQSLNAAGARYLLIGGFAVIAHGASRTTKDIDFLVDPDPANIGLIKEALSFLPDQASREVRDTDVKDYSVVRIADEVMIAARDGTRYPRYLRSDLRCRPASRRRRRQPS